MFGFRTMVKRLLVVGAAIALALSAMPAFASQGTTGNGAPSGPHFTLNIHGVANGQGFNGNNQNDIFVPLTGRCNIGLEQALTYDFQVLDPNCMDDGSAQFMLPAPCAIDPTSGLCSDTTTYYSVWVRALAKPGGTASTTTCAYDSTGTLVCSLPGFVSVKTRNSGKSYFTNETSDLLFLTTCDTTTGKTVSTPIFSQNYQGYFWDYDNQGLRLEQLRFYQIPSPVPASISCP